MSTARRRENGPVQRTLVWLGFLVMLLSVIWWEIVPGRSAGPQTDRAKALGGPIRRVVIDAGHGGNDSGSIQAGVQEKDLTLDVALRLDRLLQAKGLRTTLTRPEDRTVSLAKRATAANEEEDCVFVSIHFDEGTRAAASGVQTFYAAQQRGAGPRLAGWIPFLSQGNPSTQTLESRSLAAFVQEAMVKRTGAIDRGTTAQQFYVVANVRHPAVLVEGGFLSNKDEVARLGDAKYREQLAIGICEGILRFREVVAQN